MMTWGQINLQDANSPMMEEFIFFHDFTMTVITFTVIFVGTIMTLMLKSQWVNTSLSEGQTVECIWTLLPAIILIQVAVPSLYLLYILDDSINSSLTIKILGHQWYWTYEYSDFTNTTNAEIESYMLPSNESKIRLLEVDNRLCVPSETIIRGLIGASDVLHSWAVPSLGLKADACPGRLNQVKIMSYRTGVWYGQCSEICGANHSFMPIVLESVPVSNFLLYLSALD